MKTVADYIRTIPDFPEPGVMFRDITTILQDAEGLHLAVDGLREALRGVDYDLVVGPESRGFIFGVPLAYAEYKPFIPIRKQGKRQRLSRRRMNSSTDMRRLKSTRTQSNRDRRS